MTVDQRKSAFYKYLLDRNGLTQKEVAKQFEKSRSYINEVLNGSKNCPDYLRDFFHSLDGWNEKGEIER